MTVTKKGYLSRHEQLRYAYLTQNIYYLDEKEQEELAYLQLKQDGFDADAIYLKAEAQSPQILSRQNRRGAPSSSDDLTGDKRSVLDNKLNKQPVWAIKRLIKLVFSLFLLSCLGVLVMFLKGVFVVNTGQDDLKPAITEAFNGQKTRDGVNILILGSDKRMTESSIEARTDTIMVMNVGNSSGKIRLISFMRDTLVTIHGYSSPLGYDNKLNTAFTLGEQNNNQGAELMRQTLKTNFDLDIEYYVMIDFETFALAIDTLFPNGVEINAQFSTVEGEVIDRVEVPDDLGEKLSTGLYQTISVGHQRMNGKTLLNYARFRGDDEGDNGRTRRQQEVMQAVLSQVKDPAKLFTGSEALGKIYRLTSTNISFPFVLTQGLSALTLSQQGIERLTIPEQGDWVEEYDRYGGLGLLIDFETYQQRLAELGLR